MLVRLVTDGGFKAPYLVGKVVRATLDSDHIYTVTHDELCRVAPEWGEQVDHEWRHYGGPKVKGSYLWNFLQHEVEVVNVN